MTSRPQELLVFTTEKVVIIVGVTIIVIVLAYFFRLGQFKRRTGVPSPDKSA